MTKTLSEMKWGMVSSVNSTYDSVSAGNDSILPDGQAHHIMGPMGFKVRQNVQVLLEAGRLRDRTGLCRTRFGRKLGWNAEEGEK